MINLGRGKNKLRLKYPTKITYTLVIFGIKGAKAFLFGENSL